MPDKILSCVDCRAEFAFTESEQEFYASRDFSAPRRCKPCRDAKKIERGGQVTTRAAGAMFDATCGECGCATQVPFKPRLGSPVYCRPCYQTART